MRPAPSSAAAISVLALLSACERPPAYVYVLEAPQSIELAASASAQTVKVGAPVVLHAHRKTKGRWQRIPAKDLMAGQCWMTRPPPSEEREVADNVLWRVEPAGTAKFDTGSRADRTREVTFAEPGVYALRPSTGAWCEPGRQVAAAPIQVTVERP